MFEFHRCLRSLTLSCLLVSAANAAADAGQDRAKDFHSKIGDGVKELGEARKHFERALGRYHEMLSADSGKRRDRYQDFEEQTKKCEDEWKKLEERHKQMNKEAKKFFDAWRKETKKIQDGGLRGRSQARLDASRERFDEVSRSYHVVLDHHEPLTRAMRDQLAYLSHELSDASAASLRDDAVQLEARVEEMYAFIDDARSKASTYMSSLK